MPAQSTGTPPDGTPGAPGAPGALPPGTHVQIGEVAARTELSLRTIRHYEDVGLVTPSARSQGGFRLYTEGDVQRLMVIRRMKPLGFTLEQMRELLAVTDRLDAPEPPDASERARLAARLAEFEEATATRAAELRVQLARAEEFAETLRARAARVARPGR
ncbi:MerR family transcriptional regulator [Streptomyces fuscigenes]|uniref:MerR family transcriptional regulator n=1 Tax=Streptomyces fuscigenes TaxID=1528880 RepID=UPI001F30A6E6|nr:MerR family transcriptional regulator [Streptomyces fuscigenes]MCF3961969.1 MerR family transcriptional regulator [Streptomyces fuscigenes]